MRTLLLGAAIAALSTVAQASNFTCVPTQNAIWNAAKHEFMPTKTNSTAQSAVRETHLDIRDGVFNTHHILNDGRDIYRGDQYGNAVGPQGNAVANGILSSVNQSEAATVYGKWAGTRSDKPELQMTGFLVSMRGQLLYVEFLTKSGAPVNRFAYSCSVDASPSPAPTSPPDTIQAAQPGGPIHVLADLGNGNVDLMLDTGASDLSLPQAIVDALVRTGAANYTGEYADYTQADGSTQHSALLNIHTVVINGHVAHHVRASTSSGKIGLFGLSALQSFGHVSIDVATSQLMFN